MDSLENLCTRFPTEAHTAFHEAGHAVAASVFGFGPVAVHIVGNTQYGGLTWLIPDPDDNRNRERLILVWTAGPAAARTYDPNRSEGADYDYPKCLEFARNLVGLLAGEDAAVHEFQNAQERARRLIQKHWRDVERVAHSLLHHHFVTRSVRRHVGDLAALDTST